MKTALWSWPVEFIAVDFFWSLFTFTPENNLTPCLEVIQYSHNLSLSSPSLLIIF